MRGCRLLLLVMIACSLSACRTTSVTPVADERIYTQYVFLERAKTDSVIIRDSIFIREKGDTVFETRYKWRTELHSIEVHDTIHHTDSVYVREVIPVEKEFTSWQKLRLNTGTGALIALCLFILFKAFRRLMIK